tara:strand:+ start:93 stop:512 length:420 start_codon:yes stop_codon:yes gene_type:complete
MRSRKGILPGLSPFKKETRLEGPKDSTQARINKIKNPGPATRPLEPGEGKPKGGVAPLPGLSKSLMTKMLKQFNKGAGVAKKQSNIIQKSLGDKGYTFGGKKSPLKITSQQARAAGAHNEAKRLKKQEKAMNRAKRGEK